MARILIVDDEDNVLRALQRVLADEPYEIVVFSEPAAALAAAARSEFDVVLTDYRMPGMDGVALLRAFRRLQPQAVRLILSGYTDLKALLAAINEAEIWRYLLKPWDDEQLRRTLAEACAARAAQAENAVLVSLARRTLTRDEREEVERRLIEAECPGITRVDWGPDGTVLLEGGEAAGGEGVPAKGKRDGGAG